MRKEKSLAAWHPFPQEIRCHPEPFLCSLYPQATTSIPAGHKKGEGSSRVFTPSKKPCASNNRLLLGIPFTKKNPGQLAPTGIFFSQIRGATAFRGTPNYINATSSVSSSSSPKPSPSPTCSTSHPLFSTKNDPTPSRCTPLHNRLAA